MFQQDRRMNVLLGLAQPNEKQSLAGHQQMPLLKTYCHVYQYVDPLFCEIG